jgi:hypothetical protein
MTECEIWKPIHGVLVTTHRIEAYGGTQFPKEFLHSLCVQINSSGLAMSREHNPGKRLRTRNWRATVRARADGEHELAFSAEVHADDQQHVEELRGISITMHRPIRTSLATRTKLDLTITGNAAWFPEEALLKAVDIWSSDVEHIEPKHSYEYSFEPPATLLLDVTIQTLISLGANGIWEGLKHVFSGRRARANSNEIPTLLTLKVTKDDKEAVATIQTTDLLEVKEALSTFESTAARILESQEKSPPIMWNFTKKRWDNVE